MRHSLSFNLRSFVAYVAATIVAALCWQNATSASAKPLEIRTSQPPLPQQKPLETAKRNPVSHAPTNQRTMPRSPTARFGPMDEIATLHAIHQALSSVGDGGAYVWRRGNGQLTGLFRPTTSFKSGNGEICRHIIIRLNSKNYSREVEGIACRDNAGGWSLSG